MLCAQRYSYVGNVKRNSRSPCSVRLCSAHLSANVESRHLFLPAKPFLLCRLHIVGATLMFYIHMSVHLHMRACCRYLCAGDTTRQVDAAANNARTNYTYT